jgi:hypothetical protein
MKTPEQQKHVLAEFKELRIRDGVIKLEGYEITEPENIDERQLRAGASIGLMRLRDKLIKRLEACRAAAAQATGAEIRRLETKCNTLVSIIAEIGTEDRYT